MKEDTIREIEIDGTDFIYRVKPLEDFYQESGFVIGFWVLESPSGVLSLLSKKLVKTSTNGSKVLLKVRKETGSAEQVWAK